MSTFTYHLENTSPFFTYKPFSDGRGDSNQTAGWVQYYTVSGFNSELNQLGEGDPFHVTSKSGASVDLQFFGTGVILFGTANATYSVTVDGSIQPVSAQSNQLFSISGLSNAQHSVTLAMTDLDNTRAIMFGGANLTSKTQTKSPLQANLINNSDTSFITYNGAWSNGTDPSLPYSYAQTISTGSSASFEFQGRAIAINGRTSIGWWVYQVFLDQATYSRNASGDWNIPDNVIFFQDGLLEDRTHNLTIMNLNLGMFLAINYVTIYTSEGKSYFPSIDSGASPSNVGIIVGSVIGALAAISLLAMVIYWRRRKRDPLPEATAYPQEYMEQFNSTTSADSRNNGISPTADERVMLTSVSPSAKYNEHSTPRPVLRSDSSSYNASLAQQSIAGESPRPASETPQQPGGSPQSPTSPRPPLSTYDSSRSLRSQLPPLQEERHILRPRSLATMHSDEHIDMLANMVVEQLGTRLGGSTVRLNEDVPPPTYTGSN